MDANTRLRIGEALQDQSLMELFHAVQRQQLHSDQQHRVLHKSASLLNKSATAILDGVRDFTIWQRLDSLRQDLEENRQDFLEQTERTLGADLKLGALQEDLMNGISIVIAAPEKIDPSDERNDDCRTSVSNQDSAMCESDLENETQHPLLSQYFNRTADASAIKEKISDLEAAHKGIMARQGRLLEQNVSTSDSDIEFELHFESKLLALQLDLSDTQRECKRLETQCTDLSLDVHRARWRDTAKAVTKLNSPQMSVTSSEVISRWLHAMHGQDGALSDDVSQREVKDNPISSTIEPESLDKPSVSDMTRQVQSVATKEFPDSTQGSASTGTPSIRSTSNEKEMMTGGLCFEQSKLIQRSMQAVKDSSPETQTEDRFQAGDIHDFACNEGLEIKYGPFSYKTVIKMPAELIEGVNSASCNDTEITDSLVGTARTGAPALRKYRLFVAIRKGETSTLCLAIKSNHGRGAIDAASTNEQQRGYSIVYTGERPPEPQLLEQQRGHLWKAIRVEPHQCEAKLDDRHRLHWTRLYQIPNNVQAMVFGRIHDKSKRDFKYVFRAVMRNLIAGEPEIGVLRDAEDPRSARMSGSRTPDQRFRLQTDPITRNLQDLHCSPSMGSNSNRDSAHNFDIGQVVELTVDRGRPSQVRQSKKLVVSRKRWHEDKWQYVLCDFRHNGLFADGMWIDGNHWLTAESACPTRKDGSMLEHNESALSLKSETSGAC